MLHTNYYRYIASRFLILALGKLVFSINFSLRKLFCKYYPSVSLISATAKLIEPSYCEGLPIER